MGISTLPRALLPDPDRPGAWRSFADPVEVVTAIHLDAVLPALARVEEALARGLQAVGFVAYEAAPAFDRALVAAPPGPLPLAAFALFASSTPATLPAAAGPPPLDWAPRWSADEHRRAVEEVRRAIARGDVYQVNLTFPLEARFTGDPLALFADLARAQRAPHAAFLAGPDWAILSASPELFFRLDGERIVSRPMKGTVRRGRFPNEDRHAAAALAASEKERAENLMIVDMVRNDLGKVARPGSVVVDSLFEVETYPTVHQLTSTVAAATDAALPDLFRALFPAASITGAPKAAACRRIRDLEAGPRGVYTGAIGWAGPGRRASFAVAIRTVAVDRQAGVARYGTGGGIVWDSEPAAEHDETRAKALVLGPRRPPFELVETLRWRPRNGYFLLDRHLDRLAASAAYFDFACDPNEVRRRLDAVATTLPPVRHRVRLRLAEDGAVTLAVEPFPCTGRTVWKVALDDRPVDASDVFLFHKTSRRERYDEARARRPDCDEVVLWNERGELTEATRANLVVRQGDRLFTPPVECGLLAGVYRAELLARGRIEERVLPREVFAEAREIWLVNALRGRIRVERAGPRETQPPRTQGAALG